MFINYFQYKKNGLLTIYIFFKNFLLRMKIYIYIFSKLETCLANWDKKVE